MLVISRGLIGGDTGEIVARSLRQDDRHVVALRSRSRSRLVCLKVEHATCREGCFHRVEREDMSRSAKVSRFLTPGHDLPECAEHLPEL